MKMENKMNTKTNKTTTINELEDRLTNLEDTIRLLQSSFELMSASVVGLSVKPNPKVDAQQCNADFLIHFTEKQHATMQLLLLGRTNREIAEQLGVQESTAKVHVRSIMRKTNTTERREIVARYRSMLQNCTAEEYETYAGLPKDWAIHPEQYPQHTTNLKESYHVKTGETS
jgi:DNA-binding CsgD family transcriptional regulator